MTDRELLKWAAIAYNLGALFWSERDDTFYAIDLYDEDAESNADAIWNPLYDDGDALRLAVKLAIDLFVFGDGRATATAALPDGEPRFTDGERGADPYAATRRAIVRAAAAIGQSLAATSSGDSR